MNRRTRRITAAAAAVAAAGAIGTTGIAQAATTQTGSFESGPVSMTFSVTKNADGSVSGDAKGRMDVAGANLIDASGPITCFQQDGNKIGFFYPMTDVKPGVVKLAKPGVYMNMTTNDSGEITSVAYSVIPFKQGKSGCKPTGGVIPAQGQVTGGS